MLIDIVPVAKPRSTRRDKWLSPPRPCIQKYRKFADDLRLACLYEEFVPGDELIMELIRANHVPKRLLVVSSDHEIQTCAQRRKANFIDSEQWLDVIESSSSCFTIRCKVTKSIIEI